MIVKLGILFLFIFTSCSFQVIKPGKYYEQSPTRLAVTQSYFFANHKFETHFIRPRGQNSLTEVGTWSSFKNRVTVHIDTFFKIGYSKLYIYDSTREYYISKNSSEIYSIGKMDGKTYKLRLKYFMPNVSK